MAEGTLHWIKDEVRARWRHRIEAVGFDIVEVISAVAVCNREAILHPSETNAGAFYRVAITVYDASTHASTSRGWRRASTHNKRRECRGIAADNFIYRILVRRAIDEDTTFIVENLQTLESHRIGDVRHTDTNIVRTRR